jgi:hypothetical protein
VPASGLCPEDFRRARAFRVQNVCALLALGLHLPAHGVDDVSGRTNVLDLHPGDLDPPGRRCVVDDAQQARIDLVALAQRLVEIHRAHDGAKIGRRELQ